MLHTRAAASHRIWHLNLSVLVLAGLLWHGAHCVARTAADDAATPAPAMPAPAPAVAAPLPDTDGDGLLPKPPAFTGTDLKLHFAAGLAACYRGCATPFGTVLGAADGVAGYSNCAPTCIKPQYAFLDLGTGEESVRSQDPHEKNLRYVGITYQCVEYARRWWMKNLGLAFGDVDGAGDIIYLTEAENIRTGQTVPLARSINGSAQRPPKKGDLIVYYPDRQQTDWRFGHVAVVVDVDLSQGSVALAEENYDNTPWQDAKGFARRIRLFASGGRYTLIDVPLTQVTNPDGGRVAGWIYPLSAK